MNFLGSINKETLIICKNSFKEKVLSLNKLIPVKLMSIDEFIKKYCFSYDERSIIYLMKKYNYKYEVAKMYIDNIYYIEDIEYNNKKLDYLRDIKRELDEEGLLIYNDGFKKYVSDIDIIIYDIRITKYLKRIFNDLKYRVIDREYHNYYHDVYSFNTMEEECEYVAYQISKLIDSGVDIKKIKMCNVDKSYYNTLERIFSLFNLRINIPYKERLSTYKIVKDFIKYYYEYSLEDALNMIDKDDVIYEEIIKIINKYIKYQDKDLIIYKLENSFIYSVFYDNGIDIIDYLDYISSDNEYIFMIGFNDGIIPKCYRDIEYISDDLCKYVYIDDTKDKNKYLFIDIIKNILDIKNLVITYKDSDFLKSYYPSVLINNFNVIKNIDKYLVSYSEVYNKIKLMKCYDEYYKYGYISDDFFNLYNNFKINYNSYDNKYKKIDRGGDKLVLSYSKMDKYNRCAFRYYLDEILKLNIYKEDFSTFIGKMVHFVMEKCLSNNIDDIDKYVNLFISERVFSKREYFFIDKYRLILRKLMDQVLLEKEYGLFDKALYEKKVLVNYDDNVIFMGVIDKILYYLKDNKTYIALIDYKTGNDIIDLKYLKYGLDMQLPIYLYLSSKLPFNNPVYVGFYLQKINIREDDFRLVGYSNSDSDILKIIDKNYYDSKIIKSLKTLKDGRFYKYSKVISDDEINEIKNKTESEIIRVIDKIKNNCFEINPKVIDGVNKGCEYCKYIDICALKKEDMIEINTNNNEEME